VPTGDQLLLISDLTLQRHEQAQRLAQQERILQADKDKAVVTLAGSIAHDFNNLLAVILGFSKLAADRIKKLSTPGAGAHAALTADYSALARSVDNVVASAERGRQVVSSLTALTRDRKAETSDVDLRDVASRSEQLLRVLFPASARFELRLDSN